MVPACVLRNIPSTDANLKQVLHELLVLAVHLSQGLEQVSQPGPSLGRGEVLRGPRAEAFTKLLCRGIAKPY